MLTKKVTISLTPEQQEKARSLSKDLFGKENISGLVGFLIEHWEKEQKKLPKNLNRSGNVAMEHNVSAMSSGGFGTTNLSKYKK